MPRDRDEPVRLTKIYTRGGDAGQTSLGDGSRVSKLDARIAAYGTVDELNALIGVVVSGECPASIRGVLVRVQNELFDLGADLSVPIEHSARLRVTQEQVDRLEGDCDSFNAELSEPVYFAGRARFTVQLSNLPASFNSAQAILELCSTVQGEQQPSSVAGKMQGTGTNGASSCYAAKPCNPTPTRTASWGSVKSIYR